MASWEDGLVLLGVDASFVRGLLRSAGLRAVRGVQRDGGVRRGS